MENFTLPTYLFYNNSNPNPLGGRNSGNDNSSSNPNSNSGISENVNQPIYYGNGFSFDGRVYTINDPSNVKNRGFLDPITMKPFNMSYQPYAKNLSNAMEHVVQGHNPTQWMDTSIYGHNAARFYLEFMRYTYTNREPYQYWNSAPIRRAIKKLP